MSLYPYHCIVTDLVTAHNDNPICFDWKSVDIRFRAPERELALDEIIHNKLAAEQKSHGRGLNRQFTDFFKGPRHHFEELFKQKITNRPASFHELMTRLQVPGGTYWDLGKQLYARPAGIEPDENAIRKFMAACPPVPRPGSCAVRCPIRVLDEGNSHRE